MPASFFFSQIHCWSSVKDETCTFSPPTSSPPSAFEQASACLPLYGVAFVESMLSAVWGWSWYWGVNRWPDSILCLSVLCTSLSHEEIILNVSLCFLSVAVTRKLYLYLLLVDSDVSDILEVSSGGFCSQSTVPFCLARSCHPGSVHRCPLAPLVFEPLGSGILCPALFWWHRWSWSWLSLGRTSGETWFWRCLPLCCESFPCRAAASNFIF